jgi:hypothetical protein
MVIQCSANKNDLSTSIHVLFAALDSPGSAWQTGKCGRLLSTVLRTGAGSGGHYLLQNMLSERRRVK